MTQNEQHNTLISIENLKTYFKTMDGTVRAVDGVTFDIRKGEALGLVGDSLRKGEPSCQKKNSI